MLNRNTVYTRESPAFPTSGDTYTQLQKTMDVDSCGCIGLPLHAIGWSQDSAANTFEFSDESHHQLVNLLRGATLEAQLTWVKSYPPIRVIEYNSSAPYRWITVDTQRLWLFRSVLPRGTLVPAVIFLVESKEGRELAKKLAPYLDNTGASVEGPTLVVRK